MSHGESEIELYNYEGLYGHLTVYGFLYYDKAYCERNTLPHLPTPPLKFRFFFRAFGKTIVAACHNDFLFVMAMGQNRDLPPREIAI